MSQNPIDKLKSVDWRGLVKTATQKVKQYTLNLSPLEIKVEDATNLETWGPHGSVMGEIAEACFDPEGYRQVFGVLARRLQEDGENWRMCYKALLLLEHLIKHGPNKVADDVLASMTVLERLQRFQYKDANGKDHGANVRHRAQEISQLVQDPERVREEREKARANKAKYTGVSAAQMRMGYSSGSSGFGGTGSRTGTGRFDPASLVRPGGGNAQYSSSSSSFGASRGGYGSSSTGGYGGGGNSSGSGGHISASMSRRPAENTGYGVRSAGNSQPSSPLSGPAVNRDDALEATRARIEKLKMEQQAAKKSEDFGTDNKHGLPQKKKLTDVKVNPKIAASLGLKPVVAPPKPAPSASAAAAAAPAVPEIDLLGGLDDEESATQSASAAAPAAGGASEGEAWDAFGDTSAAATSAHAQPSFDPFADMAAGPPPPTTAAAAGIPAMPVPSPTKAAAQPVVRTALPEDVFSDLTGLNKPLEPMGHKKSPLTSPTTASMGAGPAFNAFTTTQSPPAAPAPIDQFGFADFSAASAAATSAAPAPASAAAKDPFADLLG